jgi:hypothetical protein
MCVASLGISLAHHLLARYSFFPLYSLLGESERYVNKSTLFTNVVVMRISRWAATMPY